MRVLILNDHAAPVGGAEVLTLALRDELSRRGHDARVFASRAVGEGPVEYSCFGTTSRLRTVNRTANPRAYHSLRGVLRSFRPDVVHVRMFMTQLSPLVLPLLRKLPSLYHAAWYELICPTGLKLLPTGEICRQPAGRACHQCLSPHAWTVLMIQRRLLERWRGVFDLYVANSEAMRRRLEEYGIHPTTRVWNGVLRRPARPPLDGPPLAAYAGRLSHEKGLAILVEAFAEVARRQPDARLLVMGDGPERARLERMAAERGVSDRITWTGHRPRHEVEQALDAAWVQVVPSLLEEPFGLAVAEAMMRGTAVVATELGGPVELIGPSGGGLLVPPNDPGRLAEALVTILGDRERAETLGVAGRDWALDRLSIEACADQFLTLYQEIADRRNVA